MSAVVIYNNRFQPPPRHGDKFTAVHEGWKKDTWAKWKTYVENQFGAYSTHAKIMPHFYEN